MATRNDILQLLQTKESGCVENKNIILKLLNEGELDRFVCKINKNTQITLINFTLFEKDKLNGVEQFIINLDAFISYFSEKLLVSINYHYVLVFIFLKSKFSYVLLDNRFIYDGGKNQEYYYFNFQKMMTEQFLDNLLVMRFYVYPFLKNANINLDKLGYDNRSYCLSYELLISLFLTNRSDLMVIISNFFINIRKNYITKHNSDPEYLNLMVYMWKLIFENFQEKFYYVTKLYDFKYLKYSFKNNLINRHLYQTLLKANSIFSDRIQTMIADNCGNIIFESNPKYIKSMLKCVILNKKNLRLKHIRGLTFSKIHFSDGFCLKQKTLIYPIYNSNYIIGYIMFLLPHKILDDDKRYMELIIGDKLW